MHCDSCKIDIPAVWIHCINTNICPQCGGAIYSEDQKELLEGLREAIKLMENVTTEGLVGWLLTNYKLEKIGEAEPTKFHKTPEIKQEEPEEKPNDINKLEQQKEILKSIDSEDGEEKVEEVKVNQESVDLYNKYLERTLISKQLKDRPSLQEIVAKVKGSAGIVMDVGELEEEGADPGDEDGSMDEFEAAAAGVQAAMLKSRKAPKKPYSEDINSGEDIHPILQAKHMAQLAKQKAALNGASKGSFRRSE
jgi:hypothetical protein